MTPDQLMAYWLGCYQEWKIQLAEYQNQYDQISGLTARLELVPEHGQGQVSEPVFRDVIRRMEIEDYEIPLLRTRIYLLDKACEGLDEQEQKYIALCMEKSSPSTVRYRMKWSRSTFFRKRKAILTKMYHLIEPDSLNIWFPPLVKFSTPLSEQENGRKKAD